MRNHPPWRDESFRTIHLICPDAAVKFGTLCESEYLASELARTSTSILIPRIHRFFRLKPGYGPTYMVMQWIQGQSLDQCWGELSIWRKIKVTWTLRGYVKQMRQISNPVPGKIGPMGSSDYVWHGPLFGELVRLPAYYLPILSR